MIIDLDADLVDKSACQISWCSELCSPPLSQTLAKLHDGVYFWTNSLNWNLIIDLDGCLIYKHARQILQCFELFGPTLNRTLAKMHDKVSLLTIFSQLKFEHIFGCPFDRQACTPTFTKFRAIFTPFNPNLCETTQRSFTFYKFLRIKIWSFILMHIWMISAHTKFHDLHSYF